jgi:lysophospholipase L1-like esterase
VPLRRYISTRMLRILLLLLVGLAITRAEDFLGGAKRILFLGDSITHSGQYVDEFETFLVIAHPERKFSVINCGLPSETVSGLSEAGHADGKFPRPDLHERLDRVLAVVKPDLVFACYGMNCGIYLPFDEGRFAKYREGIEKLRAKVKAAGAEIIHLTPAAFDPVPMKAQLKPADAVKNGEQFEGYDDVLGRYAAWLMEQKQKKGWRVIDVHSAMNAALRNARKSDPAFIFARDGVHPNGEGHHVMAQAVITGLGASFDATSPRARQLMPIIRKRGRLLIDSYLAAAGHQRPGMAKGLPVAEAEAKAATIEIPPAK